jgi:hypothetical protein
LTSASLTANVVLHRPTPVELSDGTVVMTEVRFYVDDVRGLVPTARKRVRHEGAARPVSR